ncbi:hypothetical protein C1646_693700 [Rhizophagus diaphanus]|nr:hypothetical protein C1646_693700 [Rhizophagus diaphanus] [Rhizophagus sp. MUCL 43196]
MITYNRTISKKNFLVTNLILFISEIVYKIIIYFFFLFASDFLNLIKTFFFFFVINSQSIGISTCIYI